MENLNQYLEVVIGWARPNKLRFKPNKRKVLFVGSSSVLVEIALTYKASACRMRVLLDPELLLEVVAVAARSAYYQLWLVCKLHPFLNKEGTHQCPDQVPH